MPQNQKIQNCAVKGEHTRLRLLIGSRHAVFRSGCRCVLTEQLSAEIVGECSSMDELVAAYSRDCPDAVVLDMELDGGDAIEAVRRLTGQRRQTRILMLGAYDDDPWTAVRALEAGAFGFAWRYCDAATLAGAVSAVAQGRPYLTREISEKVALMRINDSRDPFRGLSRREFEIFRMIAAGKSLTDVAGSLALSPRSVANYQSLIKRKLQVSTTAELVHLAIRHRVIHVQF